MEYRCLRDSKCMVIRLNRNRCQYCRFKKCLAVGMSRDSVRYGRSPRKTRSTSPDPGSTSSSMDSEDHRLEVYDVILRIKQGHQTNCAYTEDKVAGLQKKPIRPLMSGPVSEEDIRLTLWQQFALHLTPSIQRVVEFAKRIPGFENLIQSDQLILLKHGFLEIWLIHISRLYDENAGSLTFADGSFITKAQLERVFNASLVTRLSEFWSSFNCLKLSDVEIGLDSALILMNPDREGITAPDAIREHREKVKEALETQISRSHLSSTSLMSTLVGMLDQLQTLSADHNTVIDWYRYRWQRLTLPPIFSEIFDIPKSADDIDE